jgi:hypothetical protein
VYIVNEIGDIGAGNNGIGSINGQGIMMNIGWGSGGNGNASPAPCTEGQPPQSAGKCNQKVMSGLGSNQITMKKGLQQR